MKYAIACVIMSPLLLLFYGTAAISAFASAVMATVCWVPLWAFYTVFGSRPATWKSWFMYFFDQNDSMRSGLFKPWTWGREG